MKNSILVYDIEVFPNYTLFVFREYKTSTHHIFEVSERVNQSGQLYRFIGNYHGYLVGFNSQNYDNCFLHFLYNCPWLQDVDSDTFCSEMFWLSSQIIDGGGLKGSRYEDHKYQPPHLLFKPVDLYLFWSKMLRVSKKLSLKSLAVHMKMDNIQELPLNPKKPAPSEYFDLLIDYCISDVDVTHELCVRKASEINLRIKAGARYKTDFLSRDSVNMGVDILLKTYRQKTKDSRKNCELKTYRPYIDLSEVILDKVSFKRENGNAFYQNKSGEKIYQSFNAYFQDIKGLIMEDVSNVITSDEISGLTVGELVSKCFKGSDKLSRTVNYKGSRYDFGSGGIHSMRVDGKVFESGDGYTIQDADVTSMYPFLVINNGFYPEHLGKSFVEVYKQITEQRTASKAVAKRLEKTEPNYKTNLDWVEHSSNEATLKRSINGAFGNFNNPYSPLYDPKVTLQTTLNGQLFIAMLCEAFEEAGIKVISANTDGVTVYLHDSKRVKYDQICKDWQEYVLLNLEFKPYQKVVFRNVNNYIWIDTEGKVKKKGMFETDPDIDKSNDFLVIAKALEVYFKDGVQPDHFIRNHKEILDFCMAPKVDRSYTVIWNRQEQQRLNRVYVSKRGAYLYKVKKDGGKKSNMLKGYGVQLFNKFEEKPFEQYNINYDFYVVKVNEIINEIQPLQRKLF